jgi:hypothetical protein
MWSEGNTPKIGETTVGFSFMTMFQHTSRFRSRFLHKEQSETSCTISLGLRCFWALSRSEMSMTWFLTISVINAIDVLKAHCFHPGEAGVYLFP